MTLASRARYWLPLIPLLGLLGVTYWLNQQVQPVAAQPDSSKRHDPDASMENFSAVKYNLQGVPRFITTAKKLLHYPDNDSTELDAPVLTTLTAGRPPIHTAAQRGLVSSKGDEVFLHGNVRVVREASADREELTLLTEYLHVMPEKDLADTDRAVTVRDAHNTVNAIGMKMDNNARTVEFLAQVKSEHVPVKK
ncbi:MAG TPA: LPS export ABC transporter periplasmic protein LptC [Gallionella sp.]|nr:LPS export ABC transporter periplasmic protein LptC [Gallionella sp.]